MRIDLNADLGEGAGTDADLLPLVSSANVSCGFHAGDADTVRATLELAAQHGVTVGAHPGYADREHFGRRELALTDKQVATLLIHQLGAIVGLSRICRSVVRYLKPHGALYNQACRDPAYAKPVAAAAFLYGLSLVGLPGSELEKAAAAVGLPFVPEGFADRRYRPDGSLVPRAEPDALIRDPKDAVEQVEWLIRDRGVRTVCVHGDTPDAVAFVRAVRTSLEARGHEICAHTGCA
jgi:UPF0271 protein